MLFFCLVAASGPSQEQHQLHPSRASPERAAPTREADTSTHERAAGVAREQYDATKRLVDTMSLEMIDAEMTRLLRRRDMLCSSAERTVHQNGTATSSEDRCNSTAFVPRALGLSAQRQEGADAAASSDALARRDPGAELCPGHPNILLSSPSCATAGSSKAKEDEPCPGHPHIHRSSPTCLEKMAADPSAARQAGSKKPPPPQQQQEHGIGQQGSAAQKGSAAGQAGQAGEGEENKMIDMEAILVICIFLIFLTMFFEWLRHFLQTNIPHMMAHIVTALFGELTVTLTP